MIERLAETEDWEKLDAEWLADQFKGLTDSANRGKPSAWAEKHRYLHRVATRLPGDFSDDVTPYLREIVDRLDRRSP